MRFSSLFLSLSLLFSIQIVSVLTGTPTANLTGTWKTPYIYTDSDSNCCVPESIYIETVPSGGYKGTWKYPTSAFNDKYSYKCTSLFGYSGSGSMNLYNSSNGIHRAAYYKTSYTSVAFQFEITGDNQLYVTIPSSSYYSSSYCRFAMTTKSSGDPLVGGLIFLAIILICGVCICLKRAQRKQIDAIAKENPAFSIHSPQQPNPLNNYNFNSAPGNTYIAPGMHVGFGANQQTYPQQQNFAPPQQYAPQGFPQQNNQGYPQGDAQMNVNFGVQGQAGPQMTMNMNVNGGYDPYQQRF